MKKWILTGMLFLLGLTGCSAPVPAPTASATAAPPPSATPAPSSTATPQPSATQTATVTATATATVPPYPAEGRGPSGFESGVNPLTGLEPADPAILQRRPLVIKVENLPREHRPQSGLNSADIVYEYYTEQGSTRFAAVYYGQDAAVVGPIRSGRFFDVNVVEMYKAVFAFGSAYSAVWNRFVNSEFANRMVLENSNSCPALCRDGENGLLVANTAEMNAYLRYAGLNNLPQPLEGMYFHYVAPPGGTPAEKVYLRYSGAIYNRWDWSPTLGQYLRYAETQNDVNHNNEQYALLTDKLDGSPISADTLVTLCVPHQYYYQDSEIDVVDILPSPAGGSVVSCDGKSYAGGSGPAYVARDGQMYAVTWKRENTADMISLVDAAGQPFAFKPGRTWFEVIGASSQVEQLADGWKFTFQIAP